MLYWPEAAGERIDVVGYNHAVMLLRNSLSQYITEDPAKADYRVYCNLPWHGDPAWLKKEGLPVMAYTMYESTRVPSGWVNFLNRHVDIVLVPSQWCRSAMRASGVNKPIFIVSLGVDETESAAKYSTKTSPYIFLWQGVAYDPRGRKGVDIAVKAFRELKRGGALREEDELVLKFRPYKETNFEMDSVRSPDGIRYIQSNLARAELVDLYRQVDCCINPTRAEGFGLIPLEQAAMGKPVLMTGYSMPYLDIPSIKLDYKLTRSPVVWNHKHLVVSVNGLSFNVGGMTTDVVWTPVRLRKRPTRSYESIGPDGFKEVNVGPVASIFARVNNALSDLQGKVKFYRGYRHKPITIYQEYPGLDAEVSVEDLKAKMMWCYTHRDEAEDIGFQAREYVRRHWGLDRISREFQEMVTTAKECGVWRKRT